MNIYRGNEQYRNIDGLHTSDGFLIVDVNEHKAVVDTIDDADIIIVDKHEGFDKMDSLIDVINQIIEIYGYKINEYLPCIVDSKLQLRYTLDVDAI